jgi:hypothetical protein
VAESRCPACQGQTEAVFNLVEKMIERASDSHCEVELLLHPSALDNMGHIGAELSETAAARLERPS